MPLEIRALLTKYIHAPVFDFYITQYLWYIHERLCKAAGHGYLNTVKYLVSIGANVHEFNDQALQWAVDNGHLDTINYLKSIKCSITRVIQNESSYFAHIETI